MKNTVTLIDWVLIAFCWALLLGAAFDRHNRLTAERTTNARVSALEAQLAELRAQRVVAALPEQSVVQWNGVVPRYKVERSSTP